jgi:hypothetical protein
MPKQACRACFSEKILFDHLIILVPKIFAEVAEVREKKAKSQEYMTEIRTKMRKKISDNIEEDPLQLA